MPQHDADMAYENEIGAVVDPDAAERTAGVEHAQRAQDELHDQLKAIQNLAGLRHWSSSKMRPLCWAGQSLGKRKRWEREQLRLNGLTASAHARWIMHPRCLPRWKPPCRQPSGVSSRIASNPCRQARIASLSVPSPAHRVEREFPEQAYRTLEDLARQTGKSMSDVLRERDHAQSCGSSKRAPRAAMCSSSGPTERSAKSSASRWLPVQVARQTIWNSLLTTLGRSCGHADRHL